jgi:hypothetical protein
MMGVGFLQGDFSAALRHHGGLQLCLTLLLGLNQGLGLRLGL